MTSQSGFSSNTMFQSINDDLNASLATADELSREFSSLMTQVTPRSTPTSAQISPFYTSSSSSSFSPEKQRDKPSITTTAPSPTPPPASPYASSSTSSPYASSYTTSSTPYTSSYTSSSTPYASSYTSSSTPYASSYTSSTPYTTSTASPYITSFTSSTSSPYSSSFTSSSTTPRISSPKPSGRLPYSSSSLRSSSSSSLRSSSSSSLPLRPHDSLTSTGSSRQPPPSPHEGSSPLPHLRHGSAPQQLSPNHSPRAQRRSSPSHYDRSPRGSIGSAPGSPATAFDQSVRGGGLLVPHDTGSLGRRSPGRNRSPSPRPLSTPTANTLPRNYGGGKNREEVFQGSGQWNETDLDVFFNKKPHHTYEPSDWIRPVPSSGWRESDLDGPTPAASTQKDYAHSSLPRNARMAPPPDAQPIVGRISIPPAGPCPRQRRPIPLSVIMRLQNPRLAGAPLDLPWGGGAMPPPREVPPPWDIQPALYREGVSGELDSDRLEPVEEGPPSPLEPRLPRPLSPTRLQPVLAPQDPRVRDLEELLRLRAQIPRALKRRGSEERASQQQPSQYKSLINRLLQRGPGPRGGALTSDSSDGEEVPPPAPASPVVTPSRQDKDPGHPSILRRSKRRRPAGRRARLSPLVLLLDGALVGELEVVQRAAQEVEDPSQPNDEGITALHNAICGGHPPVVEFLVRLGANVSAPDSHGWTPLHCSASCNDRPLCEFLVRNGAAVMATTESDGATAAQKCDPYAPGYEQCESFLRGVEEALGVDSGGVLYALWSFASQAADELSFQEGDMVTILQKTPAADWWWASLCGREGFVPNNYFGLFPKVRPKSLC